MKENDFNGLVTKTFNNNENAWAYKIPDPQGMAALSSIKRPCDIIAVYNNESYYIESKLLKNEFLAFNFSRIEEHQIYHLTRIKKSNPNTLCLIFVAYWVSRKIYEFFVFDIDFILEQMKTNKSILKKKILEMRNKNMSIKISKGKFNIDEMRSKIIGKEILYC